MKYNVWSIGRLLVLPIIAWALLDRYVFPSFYVFDPKLLQQLCKESIAEYGDDSAHPNRTLLFHDLADRLRVAYPKYITTLNWEKDWVLNTAGNAMGAMLLLHASVTEYLIIFGTPVGTEGHTGIHVSDDYFTILTGEQTFFYPGQVEKTTYRPGDQNWMKRGDVGQFALEGFALELAQGCIPCMMPFGLIECLTSTMDYISFFKTIWFTAKYVTLNLLQGKI